MFTFKTMNMIFAFATIKFVLVCEKYTRNIKRLLSKLGNTVQKNKLEGTKALGLEG